MGICLCQSSGGLGIYNLPTDAIQGFLSYGFTLGDRKITVGLVLAAVAILYGSFIISWVIQAVFVEGVSSRRDVEPGVRMSMARLMHYVLVLVGFMVALSALGDLISKMLPSSVVPWVLVSVLDFKRWSATLFAV
jgi:hypothetical protein